MKRAREDVSSIEDSLEMAKCLIQISTGWAGDASKLRQMDQTSSTTTSGHRMFECKTCSRTFSSFQALGGHRASHHKKPKQTDAEHVLNRKAKTVHECSICGIKFGLGQALGGHMRRHRIELKGEVVDDVQSHAVTTTHQAAAYPPILRRSFSNNKRVLCMDLNLTPLENDLQLLFGKMAPKVDCGLV